jgi:tetratricopeptide (TPR) repeat protein
VKYSLEDLSVRSRRGELSESERKQLQLALEASMEASLAHRAGLQFDAEDSVLAGDDALAQRVTKRLLQNQPVAKRPRRRRIWRMAAAGVCLTVAAAAGPPVARSATQFVRGLISVSEPPTSPALPKEPNKAVPQPKTSPAPKAALAPRPAEPEPAKVETPEKPAVERSRRAKRVESSQEGAAAEFREASRLRRQGESAAAIDRYAALLAHYPSSPQARASEIALGMLHLQGGSPASGLAYFERYLRANPGGQLAADALWGKTRALAALGRSEEARKGLELLIERYPRSTYATAARAKLGISP